LAQKIRNLRNRFNVSNFRDAIRNLRWQMDPLSWIQLAAVLAVFLAFLVAPLVAITFRALVSGTRWFVFVFSDPFYFAPSLKITPTFPFVTIEGLRGSLFTWVGSDLVILRGFDLGVIPNSLLVASLTTIFSSIIGFILALMFARYKFRGSNFLRIALLVPLLSTPFVGAIGFKRMTIADGVLNTLFYRYLHLIPFRFEISDISAMIIVQTLLFYPIVFLNAYTAIVNIDPTMEEQAENLGASGFRLFRSVTLPLATPGLEAGALLVFILSLEDLGTPIVFVGTTAQKVLTYQVFQRMFTPSGYVSEEATALALLLLIISAVIFVVIRKYVSLRRYAMLTKGGIWRPRTRNISTQTTLLIYLFCVGLLFVALLPHMGVILLAFAGQWGGGLLPDYFTLNNFRYIFSDKLTFQSIINSLTYSAAATVVIILLGVSAAYLVSRKKVAGMAALDTLITIPIAIPGIVVSTGLFLMFLPTYLSPIATAAPLLIMSYTIRKFPFTVRSVFSGLEQTDKALEEAAINVGASKQRTFLNITMPLVFLNVLGGSMLSFIYSMSEVSTSIVIGAPNPSTAPMTFKIYSTYYSLGGGVFPAAAMGFILMILQLVMIVGSNIILRRRATPMLGV
jgi:iron(III) transport system permease protein